mgnify:CR=1 FL=1
MDVDAGSVTPEDIVAGDVVAEDVRLVAAVVAPQDVCVSPDDAGTVVAEDVVAEAIYPVVSENVAPYNVGPEDALAYGVGAVVANPAAAKVLES